MAESLHVLPAINLALNRFRSTCQSMVIWLCKICLESKCFYSEPPEPPTNVYITEVSSRSISLAWYPAFDGNSPVLHYMVQYKERASPWREQNNLTVGGVASAVVVGDLVPYTEYQLHVVSVNSIGAGPPSKAVTAITSEEGKDHYCAIPAITPFVLKFHPVLQNQCEWKQFLGPSWESLGM